MIGRLAAGIFAVLLCAGAAIAQPARFTVDANVALASLIAISDGHLQTMADTLETLSTTKAAQSGEWPQIRSSLTRVAETTVPAALFFARTDGRFWTLQGGLQKGTISDRPYFRRVMMGQIVIGDLVISRSTGRAVTVVAVPVRGPNGAVSGLLGGSVYLDDLSARIERDMDLGPQDLFWAIDSHAVIAIHSDQTAIFVEPRKVSPALRSVVDEMLANDSGTQTYEFRGRTRTVIYRKSPLTGWRYGFGIQN
jgi:methyl-accepting chemotaxis protein